MVSTSSIQTAAKLDEKYKHYRDEFSIPTVRSLGLKASDSELDKPCIYLCGNSLGLMPKSTKEAVNNELKVWGDRGVVGHFRRDDYDNLEPWVSIDKPVVPLLAPILGALESEVALMNTLTGNLHTLMASFYKPDIKTNRVKILFEDHAFPSDIYAFQSQAELHGLDFSEVLVPMKPRSGEFTLRTEDILTEIEKLGDQLALVIFSGIQYYTGQYFEIEKITAKGHEVGAVVGWDLAHAAGNVDVKLHDWKVDFAVFCSYKYLNSGPGGIGGIFVHSDHSPKDRFRLAGWWGNNEKTRFQMLDKFDPINGALGYRLSNPSVLNVVCVKASLEIFEKAGGIIALRERSKSLTNYLYQLLISSSFYIPPSKALTSGSLETPKFTIITPENPDERGAQLSLLFIDGSKTTTDTNYNLMEYVFGQLEKAGIIGDERRPNVIRLAPNPLYNTHQEVFKTVEVLNNIFNDLC